MQLNSQLYGTPIESNSIASVQTPIIDSKIKELLKGEATVNQFSRGTWLRDLKIYLDNAFGKVYKLIIENSKPKIPSRFPPVPFRAGRGVVNYRNNIVNNQSYIPNTGMYPTVPGQVPIPPVMDKAEQLREQDDIKQTQKDTFEEAITESKTIGKINDSLAKLTTGAKLNPKDEKQSEQSFSLLSMLFGLIPAGFNLLKTGLASVWKLVTKIPGVEKLMAVAVDFASKIPGISDITSFVSKQVAKVTGFVENFKISDIIDGVKNSVVEKVAPYVDAVKTFAADKIEKVTTFVKPAIEGVKDFAKPMTDNAGKWVSSLFEPAVKEAGEGLAKVGFKDLIKKIPIVGALAGIGFAIPRVLKDDYVGASLEVASGLASAFPGMGTAASVGIDTALVAKDLNLVPEPFKAGGNTINNSNSKKIIDSSSNTVSQAGGGNSTTQVNNYNTNDITVSEDESDLIRVSRY